MKRQVLAAAISSALLSPTTALAVDFKISGHINRMIRFADNGKDSDVQFVDNTASRSRVRFVGHSDIGNGTKAGVWLELGFASNRSASDPGIKGADGGQSFGGTSNDIRHSALWYGGNWGKVWLGHTSSAADGTAESDLSGTGIADSFTSSLMCGSCLLRTSGGGTAGGGVDDFHGTFDGGRLDLLRYDTPALGPAGGGVLQFSAANKGRYEVGAFYKGNVGPGTLAMSGGYIYAEDRTGYNQWQLSGSYRLIQGANLTLFYGNRDPESGTNSREESYGGKLGYTTGLDAFSISYQKYDNNAGLDDKGDRLGVGWVRTVQSVDIYAGWQMFGTDLKGQAPSIEDFNTVYAGSRIRFE